MLELLWIVRNGEWRMKNKDWVYAWFPSITVWCSGNAMVASLQWNLKTFTALQQHSNNTQHIFVARCFRTWHGAQLENGENYSFWNKISNNRKKKTANKLQKKIGKHDREKNVFFFMSQLPRCMLMQWIWFEWTMNTCFSCCSVSLPLSMVDMYSLLPLRCIVISDSYFHKTWCSYSYKNASSVNAKRLHLFKSTTFTLLHRCRKKKFKVHMKCFPPEQIDCCFSFFPFLVTLTSPAYGRKIYIARLGIYIWRI